jgi:excisionase family DNA binding protein
MADDAYLMIPEVAELARCHKNTVRQAIASGELTAFKLAERFLIRESDARAWIESKAAPVAKPAPRRAMPQIAAKATEGW